MRKVKNGFIKNLHYLCLIGVIAFGLMTIVGTGGGGGGGGTAAPGTCVDVAGTWTTTEVVDATDCGEGTYTEYITYTVTQDGCNITVVPSTGGTFSGTVNGSQVSWTGSFAAGGGTETLTVSLTFSGDTFSGSASWTWSDGTYSCSGTTQVTGTRSVTPPATTTGSLKIINNTSKTITAVYFSLTTQTTWGTDQLSGTISSGGGTWTLTDIPADDYDLKVVFSDSTTYIKWDISIFGGQTYTLTLTDTNITGTGSLKIINNTSKTITAVYFSPTTQTTWGTDQLSGTISSGGGTWTLTHIPADDYDLKVVFSDSTTYIRWDISIVGGQTTTITLT